MFDSEAPSVTESGSDFLKLLVIFCPADYMGSCT